MRSGWPRSIAIGSRHVAGRRSCNPAIIDYCVSNELCCHGLSSRFEVTVYANVNEAQGSNGETAEMKSLASIAVLLPVIAAAVLLDRGCRTIFSVSLADCLGHLWQASIGGDWIFVVVMGLVGLLMVLAAGALWSSVLSQSRLRGRPVVRSRAAGSESRRRQSLRAGPTIREANGFGSKAEAAVRKRRSAASIPFTAAICWYKTVTTGCACSN